MKVEDAVKFAQTFQEVQAEIKKEILTPPHKGNFVEDLLIALFAGGHVLLEGLPGLGKTTLVHSIGTALGLRFGRIQFTPDLMPSDITGMQILQPDEQGHLHPEFRPGPAFVNILLADEINRASPKTQSALLEMMAERQITVGRVSYRPGRHYEQENWPPENPGIFHVLATQNPIEQEGTYPLPEAQLDRFFFKLIIPYPNEELLNRIVEQTTGIHTKNHQPIQRVANMDFATLQFLQTLPRQVESNPSATRFAVRLTMALNPSHITGREKSICPDADDYLICGPSPRGAQTLLLAAKTWALIGNPGRPNIDQEDIIRVAHPALRHRLVLNHQAAIDKITPEQLIDRAIKCCKQQKWSIKS